ncbi:helix-turn-helix transcriptional regulator [Terrimicrobium sacchariphilum]|nr:helix-turn-helix domain-containing protein [Terrimicrobium sacchariphilum]
MGDSRQVTKARSSVSATADLRELCRLRSDLEAFAVVRLRRSPDRVRIFQALEVQMRQLRSAAMRGDYERFHLEDMALHRIVIETPGLAALVRSWNLVSEELDAWILQVKFTNWPSLMALYREHEYLVDAWNSDDDDAAAGATHHHLEAGWYRVAMAQDALPIEGTAVDRAASFLSTHYASSIDVKWMAENICFVSPSHLTRLFRAQFGKAPYAWLRQIRMERAAELIAGCARSVSAVARQVGYRNASHFVRDFRAYHGVTPGKFH